MGLGNGVGSRRERRAGMGWRGLAVASLLAWGAGTAPGALPPIDAEWPGSLGFRILGSTRDDSAGASVSGAGDINGDGFADLVVGVPGRDPGGRNSAGSVYVVFGGPGNANVELSALGTRGFLIEGNNVYDLAGSSVACIGDINGDWMADLAIGCPGATVNGQYAAGRVYIVVGRTSSETVHLSAIGDPGNAGGLRIDGSVANELLGTSVAAAGDVNADGFADVVMGAPHASVGGDYRSGRAYVLLGGRYWGSELAANLGAPGHLPGFRLDGIDPQDRAGITVSGAGDVNGDGYGDVVLGAHGSPGGRQYAGEAYVVFGQQFPPPVVDLGNLGTRGFLIEGANVQDSLAGSSVAGAGDVNGDGLSDVLVGVHRADGPGGSNSGEAIVVLGRTSSQTVSASSLGSDGFRILGAAPSAGAGRGVAGLGDLNGDGLGDVAVGAPGMPVGGDPGAGRIYVVFGRTQTTDIALGALGDGGFQIDGVDAYEATGKVIAAAGDVNGDGLPDLIAGNAEANRNGTIWTGRAFVIYSPLAFAPNSPAPQATWRAWRRDESLAVLGVSPLGMALDRTSHVDARLWVDFYGGEGEPTSPTAPTVVTLKRTKQGISGVPIADLANVQWHLSDARPESGPTTVFVRYTNAEVAGLREDKLYLWWAPTAEGPFQLVSYPQRVADFNLIGGEIPSPTGVLVVGEDHVAPVLTIVRAYPNPTDTQLPLWYVQANEPVTIIFDPKRMPLTGTLADEVYLPFAGGRGFDDSVLILVPGGTVEGTIGFELPYGTALDAEGNPSAAVSAPMYTISEGGSGAAAPGDVNGDGAVNVADITALGNHIANGAPLP